MALQTSGLISMSDIRTELGLTGAVSLGSMSNTAGLSDPDSMSEFYGYPLTLFMGGEFSFSPTGACSATTTLPYYHDGAGAYPAYNDLVYSFTGVDVLSNGWYKGDPSANVVFSISSGVVSEFRNC
tara:strand:+ start:1059 stop:1436 length:378 start_codon:yes stop_codon:yes gene_type:complete